MYSKELIELYMKQKNYTQQKQVAAELEISKSYVNMLWTGQVELTDKLGIFLAIECGVDPAEVVAKLAEARAKTEQEKTVWADVVKKYKASTLSSAGAALCMIALLPIGGFSNYAFASIMSNCMSKQSTSWIVESPFSIHIRHTDYAQSVLNDQAPALEAELPTDYATAGH